MMFGTKTTLILCAAFTLGTGACKGSDNVAASKQVPAEKPADDAAVAAHKPTPVEEPAAEEKGIEVAGSYTNGSVTLVISKVSKTNFDVHVSSPTTDEEDDPCGGIDYKGTATFDTADPTKATTEFEGQLRFSPGAAHFEPSMEMIGNDCARRIDVEFKKTP